MERVPSPSLHLGKNMGKCWDYLGKFVGKIREN
jgi:hypothetical protein